MKKQETDKDMELVIGQLLRFGVLLSMAVVFFGGLVYLYRHGHETLDYSVFKGTPAFTRNFKDIFSGMLHFRGRSIIQFGILILIATPVARILFSAYGFILEKDYLYLIISLIVLGIITISTVGGFGG